MYRFLKIFKQIKKNKHSKLFRDIFYLIKYKMIINIIDRNDSAILVGSKKSSYALWFPYKKFIDFDIGQLEMINYGYTEWMAEKYIKPFNLIDAGDVVIDCGAFIGGFSLACQKYIPKKVIAVEPSSLTVAALRSNLAFINDACILQSALGDVCGSATINLSVTGVENSLLRPDQYSNGLSEPCQVLTFDSLIERFNINPNQAVLKVEAEGFERQVLMGVCKYKPKKIVVDISPEGGGVSQLGEIKFDLMAKGYKKFLETNRCLYAQLS